MQKYVTVFDLDRSLIGLGSSLVAPGPNKSPQLSEVALNEKLKLEASSGKARSSR